MSTLTFAPSSRNPLPIGSSPRRRDVAVPSSVLGTMIFVATETMFFMALMSAYFVIRSRAITPWSPPELIRLPVLATAANTLVLMVSGVLMILAESNYRQPGKKRSLGATLYTQSMVLGALFVGIQGYEWINLIRYGMTIQSGLFGATFFLLIGSHGLHALSAILVMVSLWSKVSHHTLKPDQLRAMTIFWLFIVGIWPILYGVVYFN